MKIKIGVSPTDKELGELLAKAKRYHQAMRGYGVYMTYKQAKKIIMARAGYVSRKRLSDNDRRAFEAAEKFDEFSKSLKAEFKNL